MLLSGIGCWLDLCKRYKGKEVTVWIMKLVYSYDCGIRPLTHERFGDFCSSSVPGDFLFPLLLLMAPCIAPAHLSFVFCSKYPILKAGHMRVCSNIYGIFLCVFWWVCDEMAWTCCFHGLLCRRVCWCFPVLFPGLIAWFCSCLCNGVSVFFYVWVVIGCIFLCHWGISCWSKVWHLYW